MKNKQKTQLLILTVIVLVGAVGYMFYNPQVVEVPVEVAVPVPVRPVPTRRGHTQEPEFRGPPIKQYKPGHMQQMGLITNGDETLPLYGKEVRGRRDRYNYYTTTGGENLIPSVSIPQCERLYGRHWMPRAIRK